jgi:hypothetical protein
MRRPIPATVKRIAGRALFIKPVNVFDVATDGSVSDIDMAVCRKMIVSQIEFYQCPADKGIDRMFFHLQPVENLVAKLNRLSQFSSAWSDNQLVVQEVRGCF